MLDIFQGTPSRKPSNLVIRAILYKLREKMPRWMMLSVVFFIYICLNLCLGFVLLIRNNTRTYNDGYVLPDPIHKTINPSNLDPYRISADVLLYFSVLSSLILVLLHSQRISILTRAFFLLTLLTFIRFFVLFATDIPDPSPTCNCQPPSQYSVSFTGAISSLFNPNTCNALIFSGTSSIIIVCAMIISYYIGSVFGVFLWVISLVQAFLSVISRRNYLIDMIVTYCVTYFFGFYINSCFPALLASQTA